MANLFVNLPAPAANGAGAPVDVSAMGKTKSIVCGGGFAATVNVEYSTDVAGAGPWAPLATFLQAGNLTIDVAAHWMRAVTSSYQGGAPNVDVGSSDAGSLFALLPAAGTPVDVSALPLLKTVVTPSGFAGNVEVSEDGISWAQIFSFQNGGAVTRSVVAKFARVSGGSDVWIGGAGDAGAGAGGASALLSLYGDGSFGDHTTAGEETWTTVTGAPGAPVVPGGVEFPFAFFNDLTISPGDSVAVGDLNDKESASAVVIFVKGTLTIGAGARIHSNGGDAAPSTLRGPGAVGLGRHAIVGSSDGGNGGLGALGPSAGIGGVSSGNQPALSWASMSNPVGRGGASTGVVQLGGICGQSPSVSWPYSLSQAISVAALLYTIGGGGGGGGGGAASINDIGGSGGGGGATVVIFARKIVASPGSIQCKGGNGGEAISAEPGVNQNAGGGMGGCGGTIIIVTDEATIAGICDVSGGVGGFPSEGGGNQGATGNPGAIVAMNPMLAAQIPV
jgi:hypothetical protein